MHEADRALRRGRVVNTELRVQSFVDLVRVGNTVRLRSSVDVAA